jgi:hypothetical protein
MKKIQQLIATLLIIIFVGGHIAQPVLANDIPQPDPVPQASSQSVPTPDKTEPEQKAVPTPEKSAPSQEEMFADPTPTPKPEQATNEQTREERRNKKKNNESQQANTATPTSTPDAVSSTGSQKASDGTSPTIATGQANVSGTAVNGVNTNINTGGSTSGSGATVSNTKNGQNSTNSASATTNTNSLNNQNNSAQVDNDLNLSAVSGKNTANDNRGGATITTQDANASGTVINSVNTNVDGVAVAEFNVNDVQTGDLVLDFAKNCVSGCGTGGSANVSNTNNGEDSTNTASSTNNNNDESYQNNDANVGNTLTLSANSGDNRANDNMGGDTSITTGDANVSANAITFANNNIEGDVIYGVVNIYGELYGDIILPEDQVKGCSTNCGNGSTAVSNTNNGQGSTNTASSTNTNNDATFQNNDATIGNNIVIDATTGENGSSDNMGDGSEVKSGNTNVDVNTINVANSNVDGDGNMWLVIVNEAGKWVGKLLGAPEGSNMGGSEGTEFVVGSDGQVTVSNNGNGEGSTNTASSTTNNNSTTVQNNTANVNNTLNLSANTGGNIANDNHGDTSIKTGDANVIANIVNFVNNNVSGNGKLVVTVVNVFGKWVGDFVAPGQKKQEKTQVASTGTGGTKQVTVTPTPLPTKAVTVTPTPTVKQSQTAGTTSVSTGKTGTVAGVTAQGNTNYADSAPEKKPEVKVAAASTTMEKEAQDVITLNLAWLVLIAPFLIGSVVLQRKFSLFSILAKRISMMLW